MKHEYCYACKTNASFFPHYHHEEVLNIWNLTESMLNADKANLKNNFSLN